jgi:hypothetical protein
VISMTRLGRDGQLGNQLFQYAMLRAVAARNGYAVKIPKTYDGVKQRDLVELERFHIEADELTAADAGQLKKRFQYDDVKFNPAVFDQPDGTDFVGWYQTEKYFADIAPTIRREFRFHCDIDYVVRTFVDEIRAGTKTPLVSLHVRRGDYVVHSNKFRVLGLSYYRAALLKLLADTGQSQMHVLVFSDDQTWCRAHLALPEPFSTTFVSNVSHWHDMCAMSKCDHHIIAASSFSWWGAWLNPSPDKIVIAPRPWFNSGMTCDTADVVPASWQLLETTENYQ